MNRIILSQQQKIHLTANMQRYGGNFVTCIANAMIAADPANFARLCDAFPDLVEKYLNWPTPQKEEIK